MRSRRIRVTFCLISLAGVAGGVTNPDVAAIGRGVGGGTVESQIGGNGQTVMSTRAIPWAWNVEGTTQACRWYTRVSRENEP